jgi:hypothetical protein
MSSVPARPLHRKRVDALGLISLKLEANIVTTNQHFWRKPQQNVRLRGSGLNVVLMSVSSTNTEISQGVWAAISGRWTPGSKLKMDETFRFEGMS